jgi:hypothetical protein
MSVRSHLGKCCLLGLLLVSELGSHCTAQTDQLLPEVDVFYKVASPVRIWFQAKQTREDGAPTTAEFGPSLDFFLKSPVKLAEITAFDLDDSKSRLLVLSIGYRYLPTPNTAPTNRLLPYFLLNYPIPKIKFLLSDRNRADLDWQSGTFTWRYRNRVQLERNVRLGMYHFSPYGSAEVSYSSQYSKWDNTAIYAGCLFPIGKHVQFNPYYEHQNSTGKSPNQQYNQLGLLLNIFFGRR